MRCLGDVRTDFGLSRVDSKGYFLLESARE
jgi:hypothetical protein